MRLKKSLKLLVALLCTLFPMAEVCADVVNVNSLEELAPYLRQDNVNVRLAPGTYQFTEKHTRNKLFKRKIDVVEGKFQYAMLMVEGNGSVYDFEGVTIEVETAVFNAYEGSEFVELQIIGSNNHIKSLTLVDVGHPLDFPKYGCVNVVVDGRENCLDGVVIRSKGSFPYGYGELFGKGGPTTIKHKKHSALLVRGLKNHIKGCEIYHRAYGHCLFMQGADYPLIEGCYIEGTLTTTDAVLNEKGTGSRADLIDFKTVWGYRVPKGYTIALTEAGIRAYNTGNTIIDGQRINKRGTSNTTVKDCVIKNTRTGVVVAHAKGHNLTENCTAIGVTSTGFSTASGGKILNCRADVTFGAAFVIPYDKDKNITADITIMGYPKGEDRYVGNGSKQVAMIKGTGHNITLRRDESLSKKDLGDYVISVGGDSRSIGDLAKTTEAIASKLTLNNETPFAVELAATTSDNRVTSVGKVFNAGTNNSITEM